MVVTYPGYQTLHEVARSIGCKLSFWQPELTQQKRWEFNVQQLEALVQSHTKVNTLSLHVTQSASLASLHMAYLVVASRVTD